MLVTGATGYVGSRLVTALLDQGHQVFAASRDPARLQHLGWYDDVTAVTLDAADPESARSAFSAAAPIDVLYYLVHSLGRPGFRTADNTAAAHVAAAAADAGVRRIVYLGGFVPDAGQLSEHLAGRAEVAEALSRQDGADLVWLGAAIILGAGSASFEMLRYVGDRFPVVPTPAWADNPLDPISIRDVLHYLVVAADPARVTAGGYDLAGPKTTTYRELLQIYAHISGTCHRGIPARGIGTGLASQVSGLALPLPAGLTADLVASLKHPMRADGSGLRDVVPDPPGGLLTVHDSIARALSRRGPRPVNALDDPGCLADSDSVWAGGDALRIRRLATKVTPPTVRPAVKLLNDIPGPLAGTVRSGLDTLLALPEKARFL